MWALVLGCAASPGTDLGSALFAEDSATTDPTPRGELQLGFPVAEPERMLSLFYTGVDHDPEAFSGPTAKCLAYDGLGFPFCYDEHDGTDFLLEGGFEAMDAGSATVVAAADGVVDEVDDGHYDRCHANAQTGLVDCDGYDGLANYVILVHAAGHRTLYWHLMNGSVAVTVGQAVDAGQVLGIVGLSGNSTAPHVHLELQDAAGLVIDPFAGPSSQPETWWCDQQIRGELPASCG